MSTYPGDRLRDVKFKGSSLLTDLTSMKGDKNIFVFR